MIRYSFFSLCGILLIVSLACEDKRPNYQAAIVPDARAAATISECANGSVKLIPVDMANSIIYWKGTEFHGRGKHEGTIRLTNGLVELCDSTLTGGWFTIDMNSIYITDMPVHETEARKNLRTHLMSDDFFAVEEYPLAMFQITAVEPIAADSARISGDLTIRGVTHSISFDARVSIQSRKQLQASAQFSIVRQLWNVNYIGSKLTSDLVDNEIYLDIRLSVPSSR